MSPIFEPDDDSRLGELGRDVAEGRNAGRVHVEFRRLVAPGESAGSTASAFVSILGLRPPDVWTELDAPNALQAATRVLHSDLAYDCPVMPFDRAEGLARRFSECCGDGTVFVTNGALALSPAGGWFPLTDATFDAGVVGVSPTRVGLLWVEDED